MPTDTALDLLKDSADRSLEDDFGLLHELTHRILFALTGTRYEPEIDDLDLSPLQRRAERAAEEKP